MSDTHDEARNQQTVRRVFEEAVNQHRPELLPELFGDPFGRSWELLGGWDIGVDAAPLGDAGLLWAQLGVLLGGLSSVRSCSAAGSIGATARRRRCC